MSENVLENLYNFKKQLHNIFKNKPKKMNEVLMDILCQIDDIKSKLDYEKLEVNLFFN
jgi:hypothetical protein